MIAILSEFLYLFYLYPDISQMHIFVDKLCCKPESLTDRCQFRSISRAYHAELKDGRPVFRLELYFMGANSCQCTPLERLLNIRLRAKTRVGNHMLQMLYMCQSYGRLAELHANR